MYAGVAMFVLIAIVTLVIVAIVKLIPGLEDELNKHGYEEPDDPNDDGQIYW